MMTSPLKRYVASCCVARPQIDLGLVVGQGQGQGHGGGEKTYD